jgi:hypothetical protein
VSASSGEWRGAKHAGIYSREGFDFGIGGSRSARRQPVVAGRQRGAHEQLDTRRDMEDARLKVVGARRYAQGGRGELVAACRDVRGGSR